MSATEALLMLVPRSGMDAERLLEDILPSLPAAAQVASVLPADALPVLAHTDGLAPGLPQMLVTVHPDECPRLIGETSLIDIANSSVLVFNRHAILPGDDRIRLYFGLRRLQHLSLGQFQDYWLNHHAEIGRRLIPPYTYHQLHADPVASTDLAERTRLPASTLDGVVEVHFPDVDALSRQLSRPEVAEEALADERLFIDHDRSEFWAYRERMRD